MTTPLAPDHSIEQITMPFRRPGEYLSIFSLSYLGD